MTAPATVERAGRSAVVRLQGDLAVPTARAVYGQLRALCRRRDIREVKVDFGGAGRIDSAGVAVLSIVKKQLGRAGKTLSLEGLHPEHEAALKLTRESGEKAEPPAPFSPLETIGGAVIAVKDGAVALIDLISETARQGLLVLRRKKQLPKGSFATHIALMGSDGVFIVGMLSFLLGMTMAFQGATVLGQFGADVYVADMIGFSMVRELSPLMTAVIVTGRTGAAIAAELGTMKVRSEVDALSTMGINPARFLVLPRLMAITVIGPALTLMSIGFGILGGMLVAGLANGMPMRAFWSHLVEVLTFSDFVHGLGKSVLFAWIIGLAGCHLGLRAGSDASSVGAATTRTVVTSIFFIIVADALITSIATAMAYS